jgi:transporter family protein
MSPVMVESIGTIAYLVIIPIQIYFIKPSFNVSWAGAGYATLGALFMSGGSLAYYYLLKQGTGVGVATSMTSVYPAVTVLLSFLFLGEPLSFRKMLGIFLALCSVYVLSKS